MVFILRNPTSEEKKVMVDALTSILSCNILSIDTEILNSGFMGRHSWRRGMNRMMKEYFECRDEQQDFQECHHILESICSKASIRTLKLIRFRMDLVKVVMRKLSNVKVIHLLRDPRDIVESRKFQSLDDAVLKERFPNRNETLGHKLDLVDMVCYQMWLNIHEEESIEQEYPGSLVQVRYEDLALNPVESLERIYSFLQRNASNYLQHRVWNITHAVKDTEGSSTMRKNSALTARHWKNTNIRFRKDAL